MGRQRLPDMPDVAASAAAKDLDEEPTSVRHIGGAAPSVVEPPVAAPIVAAEPKRYRVVGLPPGGRQYIDKQGRTARMVPEKVLDSRYFDIAWITQQGFNLVEVSSDVRQIGRVR